MHQERAPQVPIGVDRGGGRPVQSVPVRPVDEPWRSAHPRETPPGRDAVVQVLFRTALDLALLRAFADDEVGEEIDRVLDTLDRSIRRIRTAALEEP